MTTIPKLTTEVDYKFDGIPIGFHRRVEWLAQGIRVAAMGVGGKLQVKAKDDLAHPDFGDQFLTIEDTKSTAIRLMFYPPLGGFQYDATMDKSEKQPPMYAYLMINGDYTFAYQTKDFGPIGNGKVLTPGELWSDVYFQANVPRVFYAVDFGWTRLGMVRTMI